MNFCGKTDVGKRRANNQDSYSISRLPDGVMLLTVCDGMGGANGGNIASDIACRVFGEEIASRWGSDGATSEELLRHAVSQANRAVYEASIADEALKGMGTTLVSALVFPDGSVTALNIGDSRLYLIENGELRQISRDHSYVQYLVDMGQITIEEAKKATIRNIIIRSVGNEAEANPDVFALNTEPGSHLLLCTDGLTNLVSGEEILATIQTLGA
ncbi:MAG: serine/threonine-protein phosphatase, partial [Ruminococcaceae bacterium]|nr:serine/threonine-protein phosphatase [Oscillospiraceae bacterium]